MESNLEEAIKLVYGKWKELRVKPVGDHPDEETLACFCENKLTEEESASVCSHLTGCQRCMDCFLAASRPQVSEAGGSPEQLLERVKRLADSANISLTMEVALRIKEKILELLETNGDILVGQELIPAPILRSRKISEFKDAVIILKDFQEVRVELRLVKDPAGCNLGVTVREKSTSIPVRDLRVTLIKENIELESYVTDIGTVTFEQVLPGEYSIEASAAGNKLAAVNLKIRK